MLRILLSTAIFAAACAHAEPLGNHAQESGPTRFDGRIGGRRFVISIANAELVTHTQTLWRWRVPSGEVTVTDAGAPTEATKFQVARSPRTIVRSDRDFRVITEVVISAGGRVFDCVYQELVAEPESPEGRAATERGIAACSSFHVEPR